jgi:hypothetical protein
VHVLVCPLRHVPNTSSLRGPEDADLVRRMRDAGALVLEREAARLAAAGAPQAAGGWARCACCGWLPGRRRRRQGARSSSGGGGGAADGLLSAAAADPEAGAIGGGGGAGAGAGARADDGGGGGATLFGFHKPPWRSVDHLHMHCFLLPLRPCTAWKYRFPFNWVEAADLEAQLRAGGARS